MTRLDNCERQLIEAHQWGQQKKNERDFALALLSRWLSIFGSFFNNPDFETKVSLVDDTHALFELVFGEKDAPRTDE